MKTLKSYVLRNHNGHRLIVLKRGNHTTRLQYNPDTKQASFWLSDGISARPLALTKQCTWKEALERLVGMEVAINDNERMVNATLNNERMVNQPAHYEGNLLAHLGKPLEAFNCALRKAG